VLPLGVRSRHRTRFLRRFFFVANHARCAGFSQPNRLPRICGDSKRITRSLFHWPFSGFAFPSFWPDSPHSENTDSEFSYLGRFFSFSGNFRRSYRASQDSHSFSSSAAPEKGLHTFRVCDLLLSPLIRFVGRFSVHTAFSYRSGYQLSPAIFREGSFVAYFQTFFFCSLTWFCSSTFFLFIA